MFEPSEHLLRVRIPLASDAAEFEFWCAFECARVSGAQTSRLWTFGGRHTALALALEQTETHALVAFGASMEPIRVDLPMARACAHLTSHCGASSCERLSSCALCPRRRTHARTRTSGHVFACFRASLIHFLLSAGSRL